MTDVGVSDRAVLDRPEQHVRGSHRNECVSRPDGAGNLNTFSRDIFRLQDVLAVLCCWIPPTADFDVQLTVYWSGPRSSQVTCQRDGRIEAGRVSHAERVGAISRAARGFTSALVHIP